MIFSDVFDQGVGMKTEPRLLDQVRNKIRFRHYARTTEKTYVAWIRRYILFHGKRHPKEMGVHEIESFLSHLAVRCNVSASTQNQAFNALIFLYKHVLGIHLKDPIKAFRAKKPVLMPTVMTKDETYRLLSAMSGINQLMAKLIYGSGLRVMECVRLRIKDVDFGLNQLVIRNGKGAKDRITVLPANLHADLGKQMAYSKRLHESDLETGYGTVKDKNLLF
jgi:integrase